MVLPAFDLVVATLGRAEPLDRLLLSLERQTHPDLRVLLVDQSGDDRLAGTLAAHPRLALERIESSPGLSRARNAALGRVREDAIAAFPDDDCTYPDDLLERVARRLAAPGLDGVTGRTADESGAADGRRGPPGPIRPSTVWNAGNSASTFLRGGLVRRVGPFDEALGLGAGTSWASGEDIDYLVRALRLGARLEHDPTLVVTHARRSLDAAALLAVGARDGASVGYLLRKHRYPARQVGRLLARPVGGAVVALARRDVLQARFQVATLRGRVCGYRAAPHSAANSSA